LDDGQRKNEDDESQVKVGEHDRELLWVVVRVE
jgi:hypothetical protein